MARLDRLPFLYIFSWLEICCMYVLVGGKGSDISETWSYFGYLSSHMCGFYEMYTSFGSSWLFFFHPRKKKTSRTELLKCFWSYLIKSWRKSFLFDKFVGRSVETQILVEIILNTYQKVGFLNFQFSKQINEFVLVRVGIHIMRT